MNTFQEGPVVTGRQRVQCRYTTALRSPPRQNVETTS